MSVSDAVPDLVPTEGRADLSTRYPSSSLGVRSTDSYQTDSYPHTPPDLPYYFPSNTTTPVDINTSPYPTLDTIITFLSSFKDFELAFPLFTTTQYHLQVLDEHLLNSFSEYKSTVTASIIVILSTHVIVESVCSARDLG